MAIVLAAPRGGWIRRAKRFCRLCALFYGGVYLVLQAVEEGRR